MKETNVVICFSLMGAPPDALILEIAAVRVSSESHFCAHLDLQPQLDCGAKVTEAKIDFWRRQLATDVPNRLPPETVVDLLSAWLQNDYVENIWVEDFGVLENLFNSPKLPWVPQIHSIDTVLLLADTRKVRRPEGGLQYDPLARARFRAKQLELFLNHIEMAQTTDWTSIEEPSCTDCSGRCDDGCIGVFLDEELNK